MTATKAKTHFIAMILGTFLFLVVGAGGYALLDRQFPASYWYELDSVIVTGPDGGAVVKGEPVFVAVRRTIHRDFLGSYVTTVRALPDLHTVCTGPPGGLPVPYRTGARLPEPLTLGYWTEGAQPPCEEALTAGHYILQTCITINPAIWLLSDRQVCRDSPPFEVVERAAAAECDRVRVSRRGIYHEPGGQWYDSIGHLLDCLDTVRDARAAGYRRAGE